MVFMIGPAAPRRRDIGSAALFYVLGKSVLASRLCVEVSRARENPLVPLDPVATPVAESATKPCRARRCALT